jgi:hypothetical protein
MSIAEVVDHLYVIRREEGQVTISFLTSRFGPFFTIFFVLGLCSAAVWIAFRLGWNGNVISGIVGGSISLVAGVLFTLADQMTRYVISIESDIIWLQRELQGIPVGSKKIYHRALISDLGVYLGRRLGASPRSNRLCQLCLWADGRSIQLESYFPLSEAICLANDLKAIGIEFPKTFEAYSEDYLVFAGVGNYLSL